MKTKFEHLCPLLWTKNMKETLKFYKTVLGFKIIEYSKDWNWALISRNGIELMFSKPLVKKEFKSGAKFTGSFYFSVTDADVLWKELKSKTKVCYPIDSFEYGMREFAVYDNNGYVLQFGHEL